MGQNNLTSHPSPFTSRFKVCVRCATFNHAPYIAQTMDGFCMQQTSFPYVCVIIDDASKDGAQEVIRQYMKTQFENTEIAEDPENYQLLTARHKGNQNCHFVVYLLKRNHYSQGKMPLAYGDKWKEQTQYVALCEGDDYWTDAKKLQRQSDALDANPHAVMVYTNFKCVGANGEHISRPLIKSFPQRSHSGDNLPTLFRYGNYILTLTTMYRHEVWNSESYKSRPNNMDFSLTMSAALMGDFIWMPEQTACYRSLEYGMVKTSLRKGVHFAQDIYRHYALLAMHGQCKPLSFTQHIRITTLILMRALKKKDRQLKKNVLSVSPLSYLLLPIAFVRLKIKK